MTDKASNERVRRWRKANTLRYVSLYMPRNLFAGVTRTAKARSVSKNEQILTYIQWGLDADKETK